MEYTNDNEAVYNPDIFSDMEPNLVQASLGKRFLNYVIDAICFYVFAIIVSVILALIFRDRYASFITRGESVPLVMCLVLYLLYLALQEGLMNGRTIGKMCTGTRAVMEDGSPISMGTAFVRTLIRFVPFEAFSTFGYRPWHDGWAKTNVIDVRKSAFPATPETY